MFYTVGKCVPKKIGMEGDTQNIHRILDMLAFWPGILWSK